MNYTNNLNLKKPASTDPVLISDINENMDILDRYIAKSVSKNMIGEEAGVLYPVYIPAGSQVTISTSDNSNFSVQNQFYFYKADGTWWEYFNLSTSQSSRTIYSSALTQDTYFISLASKNAVPVQVEFGTKTAYEKYFKTAKYSYPEVVENKSALKAVDKSVFNLKNSLTISNTKLSYPNGYAGASDAWECSDYIEVKANDYIEYYMDGTNATANFITFYNANKAVQSAQSVQSTAYLSHGVFKCPTDGYVRFCNGIGKAGYAIFRNAMIDYVVKNPNDIPAYWESEIQSKEGTIKENKIEASANTVDFIFITDTHWKYNAKKSPYLINRIAKDMECKNVIFGGDQISGYNSTKSGAIEELRDLYVDFDRNLKFASSLGNHDLNSNGNNDTTLYISMGEAYGIMEQRSEDFATNYILKNCSYWDNKTQKVRFIQFYRPSDSTLDNAIQTWIDGRIAELSAGWNVVFFCHAFWSSAAVGQSLVTSATAKAFADHLSDTCAAYSVTPCALITGHTHRDHNETITSANNNTLLVICSTTDSYVYGNSESGYAMTAGTDTEQAFDYFQVDTENKKIYITRIGAGNDRELTY